METEQGRVAAHEKQLTQADFVEWLYATLWAGPGKGFLLVLAVCLGPVSYTHLTLPTILRV